jgi:integrase
MAGCRPLTDEEIELVMSKFTNERDRCLFIVGLRTGLRISEITGTRRKKKKLIYVGLRIKDVYQKKQVVNTIWVRKYNLKSQTLSRDIPLHPQAKAALKSYIKTLGKTAPNDPLFGGIGRFAVHRAFKDAFLRADLSGRLATHTMRKTYAEKVYKALGHDILATRDALGLTDIRNAIKYLSVNKARVDRAILES